MESLDSTTDCQPNLRQMDINHSMITLTSLDSMAFPTISMPNSKYNMNNYNKRIEQKMHRIRKENLNLVMPGKIKQDWKNTSLNGILSLPKISTLDDHKKSSQNRISQSVIINEVENLRDSNNQSHLEKLLKTNVPNLHK